MEAIATLLSEIGKAIIAMLTLVVSFIAEEGAKFIHFSIWAIAGVLIMPCVFIAGFVYPKWEKWGEKF